MVTEIVHLKPGQIIFAEWLATPLIERQPKTQTALAEQLGVTDATLCNWKKSSELWDYRDNLLRHQGKDLVPDALKVIEALLHSENSKVALEAAKDVLSRWSDPKRSAHLVTTLKELYQLRDQSVSYTEDYNLFEQTNVADKNLSITQTSLLSSVSVTD